MNANDTTNIQLIQQNVENILSIFPCSTKHLLYVSFTTLKRTAQVFNRGFFGLYDFSDQYVKLGADQKQRKIWNERFLQISSKILTLSTSGGLSATKRYWAGNYTIIKETHSILSVQFNNNVSRKESSGQVFSPNYPFPYQVWSDRLTLLNDCTGCIFKRFHPIFSIKKESMEWLNITYPSN